MINRTSIAVLGFTMAAIALAGPTAAPQQERLHLGRHRPMSPEMVTKVTEVAQDVDPALAERLESLRASGGEEAFQRSLGRARHLIGLARLRDSDPQLYDMKLKELQVDARLNHTLDDLREARRTGSAMTETLEGELYELVREKVALGILNQARYLAKLQEHIEALDAQIDEAGNNFEATVEKRYQALLTELPAAP